MEGFSYLYKIVMLGDPGVGKTCLARRFAQDLFPPRQKKTVGVDFMIRTLEIDHGDVELQIWAVEGPQEGQKKITTAISNYIHSAHAIFLVYDVSSQESFDCLPDWIRQVEGHLNKKIIRVLIGNKSDREDRKISTREGEIFSQLNDMYFFETSAKTSQKSVDQLFIQIAAEMLERSQVELRKVNSEIGFPNYYGDYPSC